MKLGNHRGEEVQSQLRVKKKKKRENIFILHKEGRWEYGEREADEKR